MNFIKSEVPMVGALVTAIIGLVVSFGVTVSDAQQGAILAVTAVIVGLITRSQVTPNTPLPVAAPPAVIDTPGAPGAAAPVEPVGRSDQLIAELQRRKTALSTAQADWDAVQAALAPTPPA